MTTKNKNLILRAQSEQISIRSDEENGKRYIEGYAIVFNQRSKLIREWGDTFYEVIEPGAVDGALSDPGMNIIATINHDRSQMIARTKSGTLKLEKDSRGVKYTIEIPDTQLGKDTAALVARGDYFESSFIFTLADKGYRQDTSEDIPVRYITNMRRIYDVSIVTDGAYANTNITLRNLDEEPETSGQKPEASCDILSKQIEILRMKI